jgi:predicted dehydrogenase
MPARYRIGVIGHTGKGEYGHGLDTVWLSVPACEVVAVADANEDGLASAIKRLGVPQGFADYRKMIDETRPDIVAICPRWLDQHRDMIVTVAQRGIHIFVEKPLCRTLEEADQIIAACEQNKVKLAVAHQTRYSPKLHVIRDMIESGKIGKVLEFRGRGKEDARGGGEDLWVLGSHIFNMMHHFGGEPNWCFASVMQENQPVTKTEVVKGNEGIGLLAGDAVTAIYGMNDGVTGYFGSIRNAGPSKRFGLQILGSTGIIEILTGILPAVYYLPDPMWSPGRSGVKWRPVSSAGIDEPEPLQRITSEANLPLCLDLMAAIEDDRLPECNVYEGRTTVEMIAAVFESHRLGAPVGLPLKNRKNPLTMLSA